jgi:hypothetical protein
MCMLLLWRNDMISSWFSRRCLAHEVNKHSTWFEASAGVWLRSSLLCGITQRRFVVNRRYFWTTYWYHLQGSSSRRRCLDWLTLFLDCLTLEDGTDRLSRNVVNYQYTLRRIPASKDLKNTQWRGSVPPYVSWFTCLVCEEGEQI